MMDEFRRILVCATIGTLASICTACSESPAPSAPPESGAGPTVVMPDIASTVDATEVRIASSPDGNRRLWGRIDAETPRGFEIIESVFADGRWSAPQSVSFNSAENDFDPFFSPDGKAVLFFSNRPGGQGGDDLWSVPYDSKTGRYGEPVNLGTSINSAGNEWAPTLSQDGRRLLFSSDGHGGLGAQDLFVSTRTALGWGEPVNLGEGVNGPADDFDAAFVGTDRLVYTSGNSEDGPIFLYLAHLTSGRFVGHDRLPPPFNCSTEFNLSPAWTAREPDKLYFSAACPEFGRGRSDIFVAPLDPNM